MKIPARQKRQKSKTLIKEIFGNLPTSDDVLFTYAKASFVLNVWNPEDTNACKVVSFLKTHFGDVLSDKVCQVINKQLIEKRAAWFDFKLTGKPLPRVHKAVKQHFEREFGKAYPVGVVGQINLDGA